MAQNTQTFILVGKLDDQITPKLKKLNKTFGALERSLERGIRRPFKELNKELRDFGKDAKSMGKIFDREWSRGLSRAGRGVDKIRDGLKAASMDADQLGRSINHAAKAGDGMGSNLKAGLRGAQDEAKVLGDILKANALIKVGEAFSNSMQAGARGTLGILSKGTDFIGRQFKGAVQDQLQDIQARGALFGSLNKSKMFGQGPGAGATADEREAFVNQGYKQAKNVNRAMEKAIGDVVRTSTVSTTTITTLSRQLNDNLLPTLLKAKGVTDLSGMSRDQLDALMGGEKGVGKELATLYEQIGSVIPSAGYAPMAARGISEFLGKGTVNRQIAIFEQNPVLVEALQENVAKYGNTMEGRIRALKEAFEVAMPQAALAEARNSIAGGLQSIGDSLTNQSVGIFSMGADIANQGEKTLKLMKDSGVYDAAISTYTRRQSEVIKSMKAKNKTEAEISNVLKQQQKDLKKYKEGLEDLYTSADSPIEILGATLGPTLQTFANLISEFGNVFIGPVTKIVETIGPALTKLQDNFDNLASDVRSGKMSPAKALGRAVGEILKAIATLFEPEGLIKDGETALSQMFRDFVEGFRSIDGEKHLNTVLEGVQRLLMRIFFNEGDVTKGVTPVTKLLGGIFAVFAAPSFISGLVAGLVPLAIQGMGSMILKVFASEAFLAGITGIFTKAAAPAAATTAATALGTDALLVGGGGAAASTFMGSEALLAGGGAAAATTTAGGAGTGAVSATGLAALMSNPVTIAAAAAAALAVVAKITEPVVNAVAPKVQKGAEAQTAQAGKQAQAGDIGSMFAYFIKGEFMHVANDFMLGFNRVFSGLADLVVGLFSDPKKVTEGINKIFEGLWRLFTMCGHLIIGLLASLPGLIVLIGNAIKNLFLGIVGAIKQAWDNRPKWMFNWGKPPSPNGGKTGAEAFGSSKPFYGSLGEAINFENKHKPPGSNLVIANDSETIIPAAGGLGQDGMVKAIWGAAQQTSQKFADGFNSLINTLKVNQSRTEQVTKTSAAATQSAIRQSTMANMRGDQQILAAIKAASAAGGLGGAMGTGQGSLGAASALAQSMGLQMTSGFRPGDPGYHGANRARDFSNSTGPTPQMMKYAQTMVAKYGTSLTELIYTPLGYSIKNGKKVAPIAAGSHYNHVHVAFGRGPGMPTMFTNARAAAAYEGMMAPAGARIASVTANSSEFGSGTINLTQNVSIDGAGDPRAVAEAVWQYTAKVVQQQTHNNFG